MIFFKNALMFATSLNTSIKSAAFARHKIFCGNEGYREFYVKYTYEKLNNLLIFRIFRLAR